MKRVGFIIALTSLLVGVLSPTAAQTDQPDSNPLLAELAFVPNNLPEGEGGGPIVSYVDFQALYIVEGIEDQRATDLPTLQEAVPLGGMLARLAAAPQEFTYVFAATERMREMVGFEWIADVNRALGYGTPPNTALILEGAFDETAVTSALAARDFEETDVSGITVWHRLEDGEWNRDYRDGADPFGGRMGEPALIALLPGHLANSDSWPVINDLVAAAVDEQDSLADNPNYRALAEAISAPEGYLLQAMFFSLVDVGLVPGDPLAALQGDTTDPTAGYGPLMPYSLAVLADRQEGNDQVHLIGLVYANTEQAQTAADEVTARLRTFHMPEQPDETLVDRFGAQVSASVYESESAGNAVAVIEVRYPLPADRIDPESGQFITGGRMYSAWYMAIMQQAFYPLWVTAS
jgi:hypothetical protein